MKHISSVDIMLCMRQFATLLAAGVPAVRSCDIIASSQQQSEIASLLYQLKHDILAGKSLYSGFARHHHYFNPLVCQLVRVGEETGRLDDSLRRIAEYFEKRHAFKRQIQRALFYPALTACVASVITLGMLLFVIPHFAALFETSNILLPRWTRIIFAVSFFLRHQSLTFITSAIFIIAACLYLPSNKSLSSSWQHTLLRLPIIKEHYQQLTLARFTRNLAITFSAGISLPDAIQIGMQGLFLLIEESASLQTSIHAGLPLHRAMQACPGFPSYMIQMIKVGEESGKLDTMLHHLADKMEGDMQHAINQLSQLLEPLIMLTLGVVIGGLVIGMYLPIFKLGSAL